MPYMVKDSFLPYGKQTVTSEDIDEVVKALKSNNLTRGPFVQEFEQAVADYCGAKYAVAFPNATIGLIAAGFAARMGPFDRFITTPNSFVATAIAGMHQGAEPIFIDIDLDTGNFNLELVFDNLNKPASRGKDVVLPVHFSGITVDMEKLQKRIQRPDTIVIEDAAHAIGSSYANGMKVGCCEYSDMTVFSFHPVKTITTGEGGMVTTNNETLLHRLRLFRNNGIERDPQFLTQESAPWYYEVQEMTGNYNFTDIQAALGLSQLRRLDAIKAKRAKLVASYREKLRDMPHIRMFTDKHDAMTAFHLFVVQIDFKAIKSNRTALMKKLMDAGIGTQLHYIPIYRHPFFSKTHGDIHEYFPNMERYYAEALSLPLFYEMEETDVERVVHELGRVVNC